MSHQFARRIWTGVGDVLWMMQRVWGSFNGDPWNRVQPGSIDWVGAEWAVESDNRFWVKRRRLLQVVSMETTAIILRSLPTEYDVFCLDGWLVLNKVIGREPEPERVESRPDECTNAEPDLGSQKTRNPVSRKFSKPESQRRACEPEIQWILMELTDVKNLFQNYSSMKTIVFSA